MNGERLREGVVMTLLYGSCQLQLSGRSLDIHARPCVDATNRSSGGKSFDNGNVLGKQA